MTDRIIVHVKQLHEHDLTLAQVRDAHAVWCDWILDTKRAARELWSLGHVTMAQWVFGTAEFIDRKARLHLRHVAKEATELQNERAA